MGQTRSRTSPKPDAAKATPYPHPSDIGQLDSQPQEKDQADISTDAGDDQETEDGKRLESKFDGAVTSKESGGKEKEEEKKTSENECEDQCPPLGSSKKTTGFKKREESEKRKAAAEVRHKKEEANNLSEEVKDEK